MDIVTFSDSAIDQIKQSANQGGNANLGLRLAARMTADETIDYGMGFDEEREDDIQYERDGIKILIAPSEVELLNGTHVDFVEIEPNQHNFIFLNPNDPNFKPPTEEATGE